jgi:hypothetical protein
MSKGKNHYSSCILFFMIYSIECIVRGEYVAYYQTGSINLSQPHQDRSLQKIWSALKHQFSYNGLLQ